MNHFDYEKTEIEGVFIVTPKPFKDDRGYYERFFCAKEFAELGVADTICQTNHSYTVKKGTIRGYHFQHPPYAETKVVRCIKGSIIDVALDLRKGSKTFLKTVAVELNDENCKYLVLPKGIAHGFQTLKDDSEIIYFTDHVYVPEADDGINPFDPMIDYKWPLEVSSISNNDKNRRMLSSDFVGLVI